MRPTATSLLLLERWHQCGSWIFVYARRRFVTNHDKVFIANDHDRGVLSSFFLRVMVFRPGLEYSCFSADLELKLTYDYSSVDYGQNYALLSHLGRFYCILQVFNIQK